MNYLPLTILDRDVQLVLAEAVRTSQTSLWRAQIIRVALPFAENHMQNMALITISLWFAIPWVRKLSQLVSSGENCNSPSWIRGCYLYFDCQTESQMWPFVAGRLTTDKLRLLPVNPVNILQRSLSSSRSVV